MKNLKIRVNNEAESKEAQDLAIQAGYEMDDLFCQKWNDDFCYLLLCEDMSAGFGNEIMADGDKPLSIGELRDMVVLKRNDVNDATHESSIYKYFKACDGWYYFDLGCTDKWQKSAGAKPEYYEKLKPIEKKEMKEYLDANCNYEFVLSNKKDDGFIEIPEGAIRARFYPNDPEGLEFENAFCQWWHDENQDWFYYADYAVSAHHSRVVWQRATHPEELPFIDDEPKYTDDEVKYMDENGQGRLQSINDQYAEIEQVRQHNHYFKDVSGLNEIDVYMVLKLFNVTDPCLQHIAKKALCAGQRGHKDFKKDLQDILDTAKRAVEINNG